MYESEHDPLCYPGTTVLRNKAGIRDQRELDDFEFLMLLSRSLEPLPAGELDYSHYRAIHRHLFQDVYDWAGEPRTIRIAKGGNWFCYPENLERHMTATFGWLSARDYLENLDWPNFCEAATYFLSELNAGHAFRDGNGRTQFAFIKVIAANSGWPFNDEALEPDRTLEAMTASFAGDLNPLEGLMQELITGAG